ncbi:GntR family transcriptional regulator [Citricoccus parietis]|uniref:GntR family transcriptional regulator n=2 Tax=Citricoccus parietis TaxID=592307 RepID=A0ABV6F0C8_9MICC
MTSTKIRMNGGKTHEVIRAEIISGQWVPGERIQPAVLAERYGVSTTRIREALTRLAGEGFATMEPNKGFFAPVLSLEELRDQTELRCRAEELGIELALARGDLAWESQLTAIHHQLSRTPRRGPHDPLHVADDWEGVHQEFHRTLLEPCKVPALLELSRRLSDSTQLYRRWAAPTTAASERNVEAEHQAILDAALARDAKLAADLLRSHYERTMDVVLRSGLAETATLPQV